MKPLAILISLALCACATVKPVCLPMKNYTPSQQGALASALQPLPVDSVLFLVVTDYLAMRDANRACLKGK